MQKLCHPIAGGEFFENPISSIATETQIYLRFVSFINVHIYDFSTR